MLIRNAAALLGSELEYVESADIRVRDGVFVEVRAGGMPAEPEAGEEVLDCTGLLAVPGLVDCHTHLGDSIAKDIGLGAGLEGRVHPVFGTKSKVLARTEPGHLTGFMRMTLRSMLSRGITTFVDFREGGVDGAGMILEACGEVPIRGVVLGRPAAYQGDDQVRSDGPPRPGLDAELEKLGRMCAGIGISGANENSDTVLARYAKTMGIRAIHAAESARSVEKSAELTGRSEVERALLMRPHMLVHMTRATPEELRAAGRVAGVVACPRANAALTGVIPDIPEMVRCGCTVALGTDNVMVNPPDMFREMDFAWKAAGRGLLEPAEVLRMATVNGGGVLGMNLGVIEGGAAADCILLDAHHIDLEPMHEPHAAVVHRASERSIRAVVAGGRIVHGAV